MGGDQMIGKRWIVAVAGAFLLVASLAPRAYCGGLNGRNDICPVLLINIDGVHVVDYLSCKSGGYCPNLFGAGDQGGQLLGHLGLEVVGFLSWPDVNSDRRNAAHD